MYRDYLWSPERMKWVTGMARPSGCVFCKIARNDPRVPKKVIYRDNLVMVIMNIFPYNVGHVEVVPISHVEWPEQLTDEEFTHFCSMIKKTINLLRKTLSPPGFNTGINLGKVSGQSVPHLHFHIVPRYASEAGFMDAIAGTKVMPETLDQTYKRIMKHADMLKK